MARIPSVDKGENAPSSSGDSERFSDLEFRLLEADAVAKEHANREGGQRFWLRWIAVGISVSIVVFMGVVLKHVVHKLLLIKTFGASNAYVIGLYVAPILSMNALSIALLIAAFRKFKEDDGEKGGSAILNSAKTFTDFMK